MDRKQYRFAVLGANGYLGRHLAAHLQSEGHTVCGYDLQPSSAIESIPYQTINVADATSLEVLDTEVDGLLVFSGRTGTHQGFDQYPDYLDANELGLLHILNLLRKRNHRPRVIFPSSRLVYRGRPEPLEEDAPKESKTVYAANKLACEGFLQAYHAAFDIPYTVFRICVPYGNRWEGAYSFGTTGAFIRMAKEKQVITLYGDGSLRRTFSHVEDICSQLLACALLPDTLGLPVNIAGEAFSLLEVAEWIAKRFGATIEHIPWPAHETAIESGDTVFDDTRIRSLAPAALRFTVREWIATTDFNV